jgi:hypothetical protein
LPARALLAQDAAAAAAAAAAADAHVVFLHLTQGAFASQSHLLKFADDILSFLPSAPEPLLGFVLISADSLTPPPAAASSSPAAHVPWKPVQSYTVHNATPVPASCVRAAVTMRHALSVRRDLCQSFTLADVRESGALCTTRACHLPRELSFDFGFLSKYGA